MKPFLLIFAIALAGCAHKAQHFNVPNAAKMEAAEGRLATAVAKARATADLQQAKIAGMGQKINQVKAKAAALHEAVPIELKQQVADLQQDVQDLDNDNLDLKEANDRLRLQVAEAEVAKGEAATEREKYKADAEKNTAAANTAEDAWHNLSAEIISMREHSWLFKIAAGLGLLAIAGIGFLWWTGKLATAGAAVASRL